MPDTPEPGYEQQDVSPRGVRFAAAIVMTGFATALLLTWGVLRLGGGVPGTDLPLLQTAPPVPEPRLQQNPQQDLHAFMSGKLKRLNGYGWIDRDVGIAHIPIHDAMRRVAEQGRPRWQAPDRDSPGMTAQRAREQALLEFREGEQ